MAEENQANRSGAGNDPADKFAPAGNNLVTTEAAPLSNAASSANAAHDASGANEVKRAHRSQKVGAVVSDKMQKTVVVRVDRLVRHTKYRRYVRRTSKFMAHDELGATIGDKVRIVETRPMSARKRWRVIEIVQKAAK
jgi:small subunit ribosomal protein S17